MAFTDRLRPGVAFERVIAAIKRETRPYTAFRRRDLLALHPRRTG